MKKILLPFVILSMSYFAVCDGAENSSAVSTIGKKEGATNIQSSTSGLNTENTDIENVGVEKTRVPKSRSNASEKKQNPTVSAQKNTDKVNTPAPVVKEQSLWIVYLMLGLSLVCAVSGLVLAIIGLAKVCKVLGEIADAKNTTSSPVSRNSSVDLANIHNKLVSVNSDINEKFDTVNKNVCDIINYLNNVNIYLNNVDMANKFAEILKKLGGYNALLDEQADKIIEKDALLAKQANEIKEKDALLAKQANEIQEKDASLEQNETAIDQLKKTVENDTSQINKLRQEIEILERSNRENIPEFLREEPFVEELDRDIAAGSRSARSLRNALGSLLRAENNNADLGDLLFMHELEAIGRQLNEYLREKYSNESDVADNMKQMALLIKNKLLSKSTDSCSLYLPEFGQSFNVNCADAPDGVFYANRIRNWAVVDCYGNFQVRAKLG